MNILDQLKAIGFNFIYGFIIYYVIIINYYFIKNEVLILKLLISFLFLIDFTAVYLIIIYKLNYGVFSFYYLITFVLGYILSIKIKKYVNQVIIKKKTIDIEK